MAHYHVVATTQEPSGTDAHHARIVGLWTASPGEDLRYWTIDEVIRAIDREEFFLVYKVPAVVRYKKDSHPKHEHYLTTYGDETRTNNLNELPVWDAP